ncbi:MAG: septal ring lytic transglycosylase RlpA family protein [Burkholderiaceae bacterium]
MHATRTWSLGAATLLLALAAVLGGCASGPTPPGGGTLPLPGRDGPEANPPADLERVPDAEPRIEPIRLGGPNKPYQVLGRSYVPITQDVPFTERGLASWYGRKFQGRRTANGEVYDMYAMTAAHPTLPLPSYARVRNPANGREVVVRVNDRGPFHPGRIIDLSYTAALKLGVLRGVAPVELSRITFDDIRTGAWRRDDAAAETVRTAAARTAIKQAAPGPGPDAALPRAAVAVNTDTGAGTGTGIGGTANPTAESAVRASPRTDPQAATTARPAPEPDAAGAIAAADAVSVNSASNPSPAAPASTTPASTAATPPNAIATATPTAARAVSAQAPSYWVQLGAFRQREGATGFGQRVAAELDWLAPLLEVFGEQSMFRLQAGPYPSRDAASSVADRVRGALRLVPAIVERR